MARFPNDAELQSRGCGAVYALALSNKETQAALCDAGAPTAVLQALRAFMADPSVAISAADAVMSLACDFKRGQDILGELGDDGKGACELLAELVERCVISVMYGVVLVMGVPALLIPRVCEHFSTPTAGTGGSAT